MSSPSTFECFGLIIHGIGWLEVRGRIGDAIAHEQQTWIVTANPEILLQAKRDPVYWSILRQADLRLVDGFGLQAIGWLFQASPKRITGVDLADELLAHAERNNWSVAFVGGQTGIAEQAVWKVRERFPRLRITAEQAGIISADGTGDDATDETLQRLTQYAPDALLVAFGHPKQERWIAKHLAELPSVKVALGVGGTFDYWAGTASRAPKFIRSIGLEWLWRLVSQPSRWKRIVDAVIIFPVLAIKDRVFVKK